MSDEKLDVMEAANILRIAEKARVEECQKEIAAVLEKYGCIMIPQVVVRGERIMSQVLIGVKKA